jgi:hypothetical protein
MEARIAVIKGLERYRISWKCLDRKDIINNRTSKRTWGGLWGAITQRMKNKWIKRSQLLIY